MQDVMEPLTYFLMLSYSVGGSLYFSAKKRQATYDNLLQTAVRKHQDKLGPTLGYSFKKHKELQNIVDRTKSALVVLKSRMGEPQP
jgi:Mitochondrial calcium uniporter